MKNYSRTKGKSNRVAYRTPSRVRVEKTLIAKLHTLPPQQSKPSYGS